MMSSTPNDRLLQGRMPRRSLGLRLSLSTVYMASTWMLLKNFHHTIIPVAVIKKRDFSLKTKTVFELAFTSLSLQKALFELCGRSCYLTNKRYNNAKIFQLTVTPRKCMS